MKKLKLLSFISVGISLLGIGFASASNNYIKVNAEAINDTSWYLIGSMTNWLEGEPIPFIKDSEGNYSLTRIFNDKEEFKAAKMDANNKVIMYMGAQPIITSANNFSGVDNIIYTGTPTKYTLKITNDYWETPIKEEEPVWGLIGSSNELGNWDLNKIKVFDYNLGTYFINVNLEKNVEFKAIKINDQGKFTWDNLIKKGFGDELETYDVFNWGNDGNAKYLGETKSYTLSIKDDKWLEPKAKDSVTYDVNYYHDDKIIKSIKVNQDKKLKEEFILEQGYFYRGCYADKNFNTPFDFNKGIKGNTNIYVKYESIGNVKEKVLFIENKDILYVHAWNEAKKGINQGTSWSAPYWCVKRDGYNICYLPAELEIDHIILRTDHFQSNTISLNQNGICSSNNEAFYMTLDMPNKDCFNVYMHKDNTIALNTFLDEFRNVRKTNGYIKNPNNEQVGICNINKDSPLVVKYNNLHDYVKNLLKDVRDYDTYFVSDTMNYILSRINDGSNANMMDMTSNMVASIVVISIIAISSIAFISLMAVKRKKASR